MDDNLVELKCRIDESSELLQQAEKLQHHGKMLPGATKLINKIKAEIRFLMKLHDGKVELKQSHLTSTNLNSLRAQLSVISMIGCEHITSLLQPFKDDMGQRICVDIVAKYGHVWIKVIARNAIALNIQWKGQGQFGEKKLVNTAKEYTEIAKCHPVDYEMPQIVFCFLNGVPCGMAKELNDIGVLIHGDLVSLISDESSSDEEANTSSCPPKTIRLADYIAKTNYKNNDLSDQATSQQRFQESLKVNLDVTAMISLVSNLCNGHNKYFYGIPVLDEQAKQERNSQVLPKLKQFLDGKTLIACETAVSNFQTILNTIGGQNEKVRAEELLNNLIVVPDCQSQRTIDLISSGKLNERAKVIFGTGDHEQAVTVTANTGFVRAAMQNGVKYSVFEHEARALTELKEKNSQLLESC